MRASAVYSGIDRQRSTVLQWRHTLPPSSHASPSRADTNAGVDMIRKLAPLSSAILTVVLLYPCGASAQTFDIAGGYAYRNEDGGDLDGRLHIEKGWFGAAGFN